MLSENQSNTFDNSDDKTMILKEVFDKTETSLSDVSFAYQSEKENIFCETGVTRQLVILKQENEKLKFLLKKEIQKNSMLNKEFQKNQIQKELDELKNEVQTGIQKNNEQWSKIVQSKDTEINNLQQKFHQTEQQYQVMIQQQCLLKEQFQQGNYVNKIQILLGENQKLNIGLQERIDGYEKQKKQIENLELEKIQLVQDYERILFDKQSLFQKDLQIVEQKYLVQMNNQKKEAKRQFSVLNDQNIQLNGLIKQQCQQIQQLQSDINLIANENQSRLQEYQYNINQLNQQIINFNESAVYKEKEYQKILLRYNELEKQYKEQNNQVKLIEQQHNQFKISTGEQETFIKEDFQNEKEQLLSQIIENQQFIEELQGHLAQIHKQICNFKYQKAQLKQQNEDLQQRIKLLEEQLIHKQETKDFLKKQCGSEKHQQQHGEQKLTLKNIENDTLSQKTIERKKKNKGSISFDQKLDSFGNKERSLSCLEIVKKQYPALIDHPQSSFESETQSPIILFRKWKLENSQND